LIADAGVNLIVYACTTASLLNGSKWDQELIKTINKISGIPATTTSTAILKVLKSYNIKKVALALPYQEKLNALEINFFEANGIKVINTNSLGLNNVQNVKTETVYKLAKQSDAPEAEAVFISCTGLKTAQIIGKLEKELNKLVFSSNLATIWDAMKILQINQTIKGYGSLLSSYK
jgi:maleate isomerase